LLAAFVPGSSSSVSGISQSGSAAHVPAHPLAYTGPSTDAGFAARYGTSCSMGSCIFEATPADAPLQKTNGGPICAVAKYESRAVGTAFFSRDGSFEGIGCEIDEPDYRAINEVYGRARIFKRYRDQRTYEDFVTWKMADGFLTTYTEILGRAPNGGVMRAYRVYAGPKEHRHYSVYPVE
jgi:hypothetical protein